MLVLLEEDGTTILVAPIRGTIPDPPLLVETVDCWRVEAVDEEELKEGTTRVGPNKVLSAKDTDTSFVWMTEVGDDCEVEVDGSAGFVCKLPGSVFCVTVVDDACEEGADPVLTGTCVGCTDVRPLTTAEIEPRDMLPSLGLDWIGMRLLGWLLVDPLPGLVVLARERVEEVALEVPLGIVSWPLVVLLVDEEEDGALLTVVVPTLMLALFEALAVALALLVLEDCLFERVLPEPPDDPSALLAPQTFLFCCGWSTYSFR